MSSVEPSQGKTAGKTDVDDVPTFVMEATNHMDRAFMEVMHSSFLFENYRFEEGMEPTKFGITCMRFYDVTVIQPIFTFKPGERYAVLLIQRVQRDYEFCAFKREGLGEWRNMTDVKTGFVGDVLSIDMRQPEYNRKILLRVYAFWDGSWWIGTSATPVMCKLDGFCRVVMDA